MTGPVMAIGEWRDNGELIADVAALGYLDGHVLDCTYGLGRFWTKWEPERLMASDLDVSKSPCGVSVDFTAMPWTDRMFDAVVFDPPYKLNGTPTEGVDARYGVATPTRWQDRMDLIAAGVVECCRVLAPGGHLLVKCQDQVCSGQVRWQTDLVTRAAEGEGLRKADRFDLLSYRAQPAGRPQVHARRNSSQLLVFRKEAA